MVCSGGGGGGGGDGDGERGRATFADLGFVGATIEGGFTDDDDGSWPAAAAEAAGGAGDVEDLGDKFSEISLTSAMSKSSELWLDIVSEEFRKEGRVCGEPRRERRPRVCKGGPQIPTKAANLSRMLYQLFSLGLICTCEHITSLSRCDIVVISHH